MPAAHYHLRVKAIGKSGLTNAVAAAYRSGSRGVVASAAYRAAERLTEDNGRVYDFTAKKGVEEAFILVPEGAPIWAEDRGKLWNAAEAFETRANGRVATELEISLPKELNAEQRRELIVGFVRALVDRYKVAADIALHVGSDPRNLHIHVQLTHREIGPAGFGDIAGRHTVMSKGKESGGPRGWDAAKRLKGRKRHIAVDTDGLLLSVVVHAADLQDTDGLPDLLKRVKPLYNWLRAVFADSIYNRLTAMLGCFLSGLTLIIVRRPAGSTGFVVQPRRWGGEVAQLARTMAAVVQGLRGATRGVGGDGHPGDDPAHAPSPRPSQSQATARPMTFKTGSYLDFGQSAAVPPGARVWAAAKRGMG